MSAPRKPRVKPLPPLMVQAFENLKQAFDFNVPANLDDKFPFFIKGVDDRSGNGNGTGANQPRIALERLRTGQGCDTCHDLGNSQASEPKAPKRLTSGELGRLREEIQELVDKNPRGAAGVAGLIGVPAGSLYPFLVGSYAGYP
ncbi:MAG: hypothetical protein Q8K91_12895 [Hylemonella sp.]|nr:hypothetical protein [Hylemonella sp.]MDP1938096.1 hypothetical protein [Hylemonella sp.]